MFGMADLMVIYFKFKVQSTLVCLFCVGWWNGGTTRGDKGQFWNKSQERVSWGLLPITNNGEMTLIRVGWFGGISNEWMQCFRF